MFKKQIKVQLEFEGLHCWPNAPDGVLFLRNIHRHMFHVSAQIEVHHNDRDLEFILVKKDLAKMVEESAKEWPISVSCEQMASDIVEYLRNRYGGDRDIQVEVSEDGENGAVVTYTYVEEN